MIRSLLSCLWTGAECVCGAVVSVTQRETRLLLPQWKAYLLCLNCSLSSDSALRAIHRTENTNYVNKWPISAAASEFIYSVGGGMLRILESIWLNKVWWEAEVQGDVIKIIDPYWQKWETKFWMLKSCKPNFVIVLEHTRL